MRSEEYIDDFVEKLRVVWKKHPHLSFSQITWELGRCEYMYFCVKDEEFVKKLEASLVKDKLSNN